MTKLTDFITAAIHEWKKPEDHSATLKFLASMLYARVAEMDDEWYLNTLKPEGWNDLRTKRLQVMECLEMIEAIQRVLAGKPAVEAKKPRPEIGMYGEL